MRSGATALAVVPDLKGNDPMTKEISRRTVLKGAATAGVGAIAAPARFDVTTRAGAHVTEAPPSYLGQERIGHGKA